MELDALWLSRVQFALTIMFHYLFPPLTIGLGVLMAIMEGLSLRTGDRQYLAMARFWTKIFGLNFAMGVATGIVMEFQFGTNWATYSRYVGDVFGSALAAEGVFAFFLESGFLAIVVFGWDRVSPRMHFFATIMVAVGSVFSAIWIVVANSWQQTPAGFHIVTRNGFTRAEITDFWAMVFNPSSMHRLVHVLIGAMILGSFFVMSVSAWYILRRRHVAISRKTFTIALVMGAVASVASLVSGHLQARTVARTQPPKLAAFEGHFRTGTGGTPLYLFGIPDSRAERVNYGLAIPGGLSFLIHDDWNRPVQALDQTPPADRPPVAIPFHAYHIMVGLGLVFVVLTSLACILRAVGRLFEQRWLMAIFVAAVIGPVVANQLGWVAAEVGRQPWVVWGLLRTADATSRVVTGEHVLFSIVMFGVIYVLLLIVWLYVLDAKIRHGPEEAPDAAPPRGGWLDVGGRLLAHPGGESLTQAHDEPGRKG